MHRCFLVNIFWIFFLSLYLKELQKTWQICYSLMPSIKAATRLGYILDNSAKIYLMGANKSKLKNLLTYRKIEKLYFTNCSGNLIHLIFWIGLDTNSFSQEVTLRVDSNFYSYFILSTIFVKIFATRDLCKTLFLNYHSLLQLVSKTSLFSYSLIFSRSSFIYSWLPWNRKLRFINA